MSWETAAAEADARRGADGTARALGRKLEPTPQHLSRVLYIPRHDAKTPHLPLYDVSSRYVDVVGDTAMGSGKYTVALGIMAKPGGDGGDDGVVAYLVDFLDIRGDGVTARVRRRGLLGQRGDVEVELNANEEEITLSVAGKTNPISLETTYPIPPSRTKFGTISHPYFHYPLSSGSSLAQLRWEIHPVEDGPLRYTLTRSALGPSAVFEQYGGEPGLSGAKIEAIYHHVGLGLSLSQAYSEGVLLLSPGTDPRAEAVYVASVLAMLWRLRRIDAAGNEGVSRKSWLGSAKRLFRGH
ncbi:hypothetical protein BJX68DRAFT_249099 [Aspergillus pseudodeflectus]|uniref:Uncharacterized protein n=1 Tax=Aspergillus pseudodeflectus TaxID=176178 RepID=A0ABR4JF18_9EURO